MIIDHVAYYFSEYIPIEIYYNMRVIGRIAMPIFTFLIINGFLKTKDLKRYILRLFRLAVFTQLAIIILSIINKLFVPDYIITVNSYLNIVFSFVLILIFINNLNKLFFAKEEKKILKFKEIFIMISIIAIYLVFENIIKLNIDYGIMLLVLAVIYYILFKIKEVNYNIYIILFCIAMIIYSFVMYNEKTINSFILLSLPILFVYDESKINKNLRLQKMFYSIFLLQHTILYSAALCFKYF